MPRSLASSPADLIRARPPGSDDVAALVSLVNACTIDEIGMAAYAPDDLADRLRDFEVLEDEGRIVAVIEYDRSDPHEVYFEGYVDPPLRGRGLGTRIVDRVEEEAATIGIARLATNVSSGNARTLMSARGFEQTHFEYGMAIDLPFAEPPPPGVTIRPYESGRDDHIIWDLIRRGFGSDWEPGRPTEMEPWLASHRSAPNHDSSLWAIAFVDGRPAGAVMGRTHWGAQTDVGHVKNLAVLPEARRGGVGRALLNHVATEFSRREVRALVLGVSGHNPTGARAFYERVGMRVVATTFDMTKALPHPGPQPARQMPFNHLRLLQA